MITMSSWVLSVPAADQELGFEGENLVHTLTIQTDTGPEWVYRIELAYANGKVDILLPAYKDGILTAELRWTELCVPGTVTVQVRGTRGYKVKLSTIAVMYIREAINATEVFNTGMPTEFEQLESDLYAARESASASAKAASEAKASAETAAGKAASDASRAESARAAAELAAATPGQDGYSPSASVTETDDGAEITITDKTGTTTATVKNGKDGAAGAPGKDGVTPNIQIGIVTTLDAGSDATASMTGTPENPLLNLGIPKGADGTASEWAVVGDVVVESEDVLYYTFDLTGKTEVICLVVLTPLADSTSRANGTICLNSSGNPWKSGVRIGANIGSVLSNEKAGCTLMQGKVIGGKWVPYAALRSGNYNSNAYTLNLLYGSTIDPTNGANSFMEVGELTNIAVGSYTTFFGVGSHIYVLAR